MSKLIYYFSFFALLLPILYSCSNKQKDYYSDGTLKSEVTIQNDVKNGPAKYYFPNGTIEVSANYSANKLDGKYEKFDISGNRIELTNYSNGVKNGKSIMYYENGKMSIEAIFINDTLHDAYREYYPSGQIRVLGYYDHGLYDGQWEYWDASGIKVGFAFFKKGCGTQTALHYGSKKPQIITTYENNEKHGSETYYSPTGEIEQIIQFDNGQMIKSDYFSNQ